jgi:hypothetical protein
MLGIGSGENPFPGPVATRDCAVYIFSGIYLQWYLSPAGSIYSGFYIWQLTIRSDRSAFWSSIV